MRLTGRDHAVARLPVHLAFLLLIDGRLNDSDGSRMILPGINSRIHGLVTSISLVTGQHVPIAVQQHAIVHVALIVSTVISDK